MNYYFLFYAIVQFIMRLKADYMNGYWKLNAM